MRSFKPGDVSIDPIAPPPKTKFGQFRFRYSLPLVAIGPAAGRRQYR
jgi:hypothetical protein